MVYEVDPFTVFTFQSPSNLGSSLPAVGEVSHTASPALKEQGMVR